MVGVGRHVASLRTLIGAVNCLFVLAVGLTALLVTEKAALDALYDNGERHVEALGHAVEHRLEEFLAKPETQVEAMRHEASTLHMHFPSEHPTAHLSDATRRSLRMPGGGLYVAEWESAVDAWVFETNLTLFTTIVWLLDGSRVAVFPAATARGVSYVETWHQDNATGQLDQRRLKLIDRTTLDDVSEADPRVASFLSFHAATPVVDARTPATKQSLDLLAAPAGTAPEWHGPRFFHDHAPYRYLLCGRALRNGSHHIGYGLSGVTLEEIGHELDEVRRSATPGTSAVVVDAAGFVLAATGEREVFNVSNYSGGAVGPGCATTDETAATVPSDRRLVSCSHHARDFAEPVATAARRGLFQRGRDVQEHIKAGGTRYFVRVEHVRNIHFEAWAVVVVPEADVFGDVQRVVVFAGVVTGCVLVVAAASCVVLVWLLLGPLVTIAVRMGKAARLEDDPAPVEVSCLTEMGDLQRAFIAMRDELARIRAFVPQSLLRADSTTDEGDLVEDSDAAQGSSTPSRQDSSTGTGSAARYEVRLRRSVGSHGDGGKTLGSSLPSSSNATSHLTSVGRVRIRDGVRQQAVSVVAGNLRGFHRATATGLEPHMMAATVDAVLVAAEAEKGVVNAFHGDRFTVSFNAVRPAPNHALRAAVVAVRVARALRGDGAAESPAGSEGFGLGVTSGVATGIAQVGNLGCAAMKGFAVVGPVVSQAVALERLCKLHPGAQCLAPQRVLDDAQTAVGHRAVDFVLLPHASRPTLVAELTGELAEQADDEWMYQLQAAEPGDRPDAVVNAAWAALLKGDTAAAAKCVALLEKTAAVRSRRGSDAPPLPTPTAPHPPGLLPLLADSGDASAPPLVRIEVFDVYGPGGGADGGGADPDLRMASASSAVGRAASKASPSVGGGGDLLPLHGRSPAASVHSGMNASTASQSRVHRMCTAVAAAHGRLAQLCAMPGPVQPRDLGVFYTVAVQQRAVALEE